MTDKTPKATRFFRYRDGKDGLSMFTYLGPFGNIAQPVEIHIGTRANGYQGLTGTALTRDIFFHTRHAGGAGRLCHGAGIIEDILDCGTKFIG